MRGTSWTPETSFVSPPPSGGKTLTTRARGTTFAVEVDGRGLIFTPVSSGQGRPETARRIQSVLDEFERTKSFKAGDYQQLSMNASYILALLEAYRNQRLGAG